MMKKHATNRTRPIAAYTSRVAGREGFVLPAVIFALTIMSLLAVLSLNTADDELHSSRALRESGAALYTADAGMNLVRGTWIDTTGTTMLDSISATMAPGDTVDVGWRTLPSGAPYRSRFQRVDVGGGTEMYLLMVQGRSASGGWGGERLTSMMFIKNFSSSLPVVGAMGLSGGRISVGDGGGVQLDGTDNIPPGWSSLPNEGNCTVGPDVPGITLPDATAITLTGAPSITGTPPILADPTFSVSNFDDLYNMLLPLATNVYPPGSAPAVIAPVESPPGTCDTSVLNNWGAPTDPTHPCFDHFPIIYLENGRFKTHNGQSGQGILLIGCDALGKCDLELEAGFTFYGLILVQGEFEIETGAGVAVPASVYGSVMVKNYADPLKTSKIWTDSDLHYSSCVMDRVAQAAGLSGGTLLPIGSRAWSEVLR